MIAFRVEFKPGAKIHDQVVYAAKRAIVSGQFRPGDSFPSIRMLSKELKINPNTAQKVVTSLVSSGLLEVRAGEGTVVVKSGKASKADRKALLDEQTEELVVEARRLGVELADLQETIEQHWQKTAPPPNPGGRGR